MLTDKIKHDADAVARALQFLFNENNRLRDLLNRVDGHTYDVHPAHKLTDADDFTVKNDYTIHRITNPDKSESHRVKVLVAAGLITPPKTTEA